MSRPFFRSFATRCLSAAAASLVLLLSVAPAQAAGLSETTAAETTAGTDRLALNRRVFDAVWREVQRSYYDPKLHGVDWRAARETWRPVALAAPDDRQLYRAMNAMLDLLDDDHAAALPAASVRRRDSQRQRRPVMGMTLFDQPDGSQRIERIRDGSPAQEAGIAPGWRLDAINGERWGPELELPEGTAVALQLVDQAGVTHRMSLTPRLMDPVPAFSVDRSRPGLLVLRIDAFEAGLGRWLGAQLAELAPDTDVILDLRANPGGLLMEADAALSCFLPDRQVWATRTARSGRSTTLRVRQGCGDLNAPVSNDLAVLVDGSSRSAAELTPAALQEAGRAIVVGEHTAGAVLISQDTTLPDGGRLTLSRADFRTSGGVRLEKRGVSPDVVVESSADDLGVGRDPILDVAIAALGADRLQVRAGAVASMPF
ncbi:S41 family peptidase [Brevundimonas variabilis]|uniref:Carboxyl-terminal processing protease n=1 Tax=Brevundimonas variabilis TaxID=74312 RepID=A0A7W9FF05_9CAUL|nr:S41 family peptidase [Brevundimonas variabilis]MBB5746907.1 carboxyl-terminal processing protease [Brevundimonas variabilis]